MVTNLIILISLINNKIANIIHRYKDGTDRTTIYSFFLLELLNVGN